MLNVTLVWDVNVMRIRLRVMASNVVRLRVQLYYSCEIKRFVELLFSYTITFLSHNLCPKSQKLPLEN